MQDKVQSPVSTELQPAPGDKNTPPLAGNDRVQRLLSLRSKVADIVAQNPDQEPEPELELHPLYRNAMFD